MGTVGYKNNHNSLRTCTVLISFWSMFKMPQWLENLNGVDIQGADSTLPNPIVPAHQCSCAWATGQMLKVKLSSVAVPSEGRRPVEGILSEYTIPQHSRCGGTRRSKGNCHCLRLFSTPVKTHEASRLPPTRVPRAAFFSPSHLLLVLFNFLQAFLSGSLISLYPSEPSG